MRRKIRIVIVDENPLCRRGLRELLREDERFEVVAEADQASAGLKVIVEHKPDVAIIDDNLTGPNGIELAGTLRAKNAAVNTLILSQEKDEKRFNRAISLGVKGYFLKRNAGNEIFDCVARVARGEAYICPELTDFLLRRAGRTESLERQKPGLSHLTVMERRVLNRIAHGKTSREIAVECGISPRTVDSHRSHICEKLNLSGRNRLIHFAIEHRDVLGRSD
ncbi:MAG TPA: response regulator transcription factor [Verrucomicrobiae bacterium]|nr:response regulator transcription factor [Verrucomicrobiae bacterium]